MVMDKINVEYGKFLTQQKWDYFVTCRSDYKIGLTTPYTWSKRLVKAPQIEKLFFIVERDKGDMNSKHVHMLLDTTTDISSGLVKEYSKVAVGDFQKIYDKRYLCNYVSKFIGMRDIEYDFIFAEMATSKKS